MEYKICSRTVMDTSDPDIRFDENGVCQYVPVYEELYRRTILAEDKKARELETILRKVKEQGKGRDYDCVIGLSGGVDSTYVAYITKQFGLRALAVHMDNGWNSELAVHNIEQIVKRLNLDLETHVINWDEFKDLQLAYLRASVVDIEALTDNAIAVAVDRISKRHGVKYFFSGTNLATEFIMPKSWFYEVKYDSLNITSIHKRFGRRKRLETYPLFSLLQYIRYRYQDLGSTTIPILNYVHYNKADAMKFIEKELGWRDYGGKHCESKFTEFYQNYILPKKFNVDKRRAFFSTLILSGQMTREQALIELQKPLYPPKKEATDREYVLKKFNISSEEFERIMRMPPVPHAAYPSYQNYHNKLRLLVKSILRK